MSQPDRCPDCNEVLAVGVYIPHPHIPPDPIPETVVGALDMWDKGDSVTSVSMGGIGPGYEQTIQILAFELMRHGIQGGHPGIGESAKRWGDDVVCRLDLGFSGAQVGAAKSLALQVLIHGYRKALRMPEVQDRLIQVSKNFP